jgi:hypothetical protein
MDDPRIHAELSSLRSSISALDARLAELTGKLSALDRHVDQVGDSVATVVPAIKRIQEGLTEFAEEFRRGRVIDAARDARDNLDRDLERHFGKHDEVRALATSIIHVVSTGVIDDSVILDAAQQRMVDLPDYWLAPAIVAVAAWLSRDERKCDEALNLAMHLDRSKTALFMALLLRRHDRGHALRRWIDVYLTGLQPRNLPADFHVVIDAVAGGALGDGSAPRLGTWMTDQYLGEIRSRDAMAEATREWRQRLHGLGKTAGFAPTLARACPDWAALRDRNGANLMIEAAERHFRGRFDTGASVPADLTEQMRELVTKLAHTYDWEEERVRRERRLADAVSRTGDHEQAREQIAAEDAGRTGSLNILSLVSASAFPGSPGGKAPAPSVSELLMIVLSKELIAGAAEELHDSTQRPASVEVNVGQSPPRICTFVCETSADVTSEALDAQADALVDQLKSQLSREADAQRSRVRWFARRPFPLALLGAAVVAAVPFAFPTGLPDIDFTAPAVAIAAGAGSWLTLLLQRVQQGRITSMREQHAISKEIRGAARDLAGFYAQEERSARLRTDLKEFLSGLTPQDAYRSVRPVDSLPFPESRGFPDWTPLPPGDRERPELGPAGESRRIA